MVKIKQGSVKTFDALKSECEKRGLFKRSLRTIWFELAAVVILFLFSFILKDTDPFASFFIESVAGITLLWWIHDSGHDAFFKSRKTSQFVIETMGLMFMGMPQIEYHYEVHRIHHAHTNIIGKDKALDTQPIIWSDKQLSRRINWIQRHQSFVWFFLVLPFVWPLITFRSVQTLIQRKKYFRLSIFVLRWMLVPVLFNYNWLLIIGPTLISGFVLGFVGSLNHFHMPMDIQRLGNFPESVFVTTQNLKHRGIFATWITGGLNFHIEHHMFPTMPSKNLKHAAPLVQQFALENGLNYNICSAIEATQKLNVQLKQPLFNWGDL